MVSDNRHRLFEDRLQLFRPDQFGLLLSDPADSDETNLSENLLFIPIFLDSLCIRLLRGSVEYKCIMDVFTLSSLSAQVRAICVISVKGSCPK